VSELRNAITKTLRDIFEYTGTDVKYAEYAQLHMYVTWLLTAQTNAPLQQELLAQRAAHKADVVELFEAVSPCAEYGQEYTERVDWCYLAEADCTFDTCPLDGVKKVRERLENMDTD